VRRLLATLRDKQDLIAIGAYQHGSDPVADEALLKQRAIETFLQQSTDEPSSPEQADETLIELAADAAAIAVEEAPVVSEPVAQPRVAAGPSAIPPLNLSV
jgi:flagellum-specific ATP synthase